MNPSSIRPILTVLALCAIALVESATSTHAQNTNVDLFSGLAAGDQFGRSVACVGDVDGDGADDLIVGAPFNSSNGLYFSGAAYVISRSNGILFEFHGDNIGDNFGREVGGVEDVNGDGIPDLFVGAPHYSNLSGQASAGYARVFSGADGSTLYTLNGDQPGDRLGHAFSTIADLDGDSVADFVVSAPGIDHPIVPNAVSSNFVRAFSGATGNPIWTAWGAGVATIGRFGADVCVVRDRDNDGIRDVAIGETGTDLNGMSPVGFVHIVSGIDGNVILTNQGEASIPVVGDPTFLSESGFGASLASMKTPQGRRLVTAIPRMEYSEVVGTQNGSIVTETRHEVGRVRVEGFSYSPIDGQTEYDNLGQAVGVCGDLDGDGTDELLIAKNVDSEAPQSDSDQPGAVEIRSGATNTLLRVLRGMVDGERFGACVTAAGDFDGNGTQDVVVGIPLDSSFADFAGSIEVFLNPLNPSSDAGNSGPFDSFIESPIAGDGFGASICGLQNLDNDQVPDILIGAPFDSSNGIASGRVTAYSGRSFEVIYDVYGGQAGEEFGRVTSAIGDLNLDGYTDFAVGLPDNTGMGIQTERVELRSGVDGSLMHSIPGPATSALFGFSVAGIGDIDLDGIPDVAVGAPEFISGGLKRGAVYFYSGADASLIRVLVGFGANRRLGFSVDGFGDFNSDGVPDVIVGVPRHILGGDQVGIVIVFSGSDGAELTRVNGFQQAGARFGASVAGVGDYDNDGFNDFAVGAPGFSSSPNTPELGRVSLFSGQTGLPLFQWFGIGHFTRLGTDLANAGDVDGDGVDDLVGGVVVDQGSMNRMGPALVGLSGGFSSVSPLRLDAPTDNGFAQVGSVVAGVGDLNNDGRSDVLLGARIDSAPPSNHIGRVQVLEYDRRKVPSRNFPIDSSLGIEYEAANADHDLRLSWLVNRRNSAITGTITCSGASSSSSGLYAVSLAAADLSLPFGFSLLVAIDSVNLIDSGFLPFDFKGEFVLDDVTRRAPGLAGSEVFIQFYETSPVVRGSNGIKLKVVP